MALITKVGGATSDSYATLIEANAYIANRPDSKNWNDSDYLERERLLKQAAIDMDVLRFKGQKLFKCGESIGPWGHNLPSTSTFDFFSDGCQNLQFPRHWQEYYTGYADSGSVNTLVDTAFANLNRPDDYFNDGAIYIISGTNAGESSVISDYVKNTSTFTVSTAFTSAPDTTSHYIIVTPLNKYIKYAQIEQALYLTNNMELTQLLHWKGAGVESRTVGDVSIKFNTSAGNIDRVGGKISSNAHSYIHKYIDRNVRVGRA